MSASAPSPSPSSTDSPLSITSSIAGILTFITALLATIYARLSYLRTADSEYFRVKASVNWYKTESAFMQDLISASDWNDSNSPTTTSDSNSNSISATKRDSNRPASERAAKAKEMEMYRFVLDQLGKLEERLLECIAEAEEGVGTGKDEKKWTFIPEAVRGRTDIAMSWLPVRAKALDLVRQRDALGNRVLFAQMSLVSSRVREQDLKIRKMEERQMERMVRLENIAFAQHEKLDKLEDLVYRFMHRNRVGTEDSGYQDSNTGHDTNASLTTQREDGDNGSSHDESC